jgi:glycosyltransferase involved in cell wall biosynthesis
VRAIIERVDGTSLTRRLEDKSACARIICEAEAIRREILAQREMLKCRSEQLVVIPNGIDLKRFDPSRYDRERCRAALGLTPADFVIGTVARMAPEKNLEHLLRAIAVLTSSYGLDGRMVWGVIAGPDGGSRGKLEAEAERLGIANRMKILQATEKVPELLRALDAFVMTSFYEGAPFALLEAIAMGLPVVASAVGAITEIIDGNGILVSVLHPEETAKALFQLLSNSKLRRSLSHRSEMVRNRYDLDRMVREYERVVTSTLEDTVAPPLSSSVDDL